MVLNPDILRAQDAVMNYTRRLKGSIDYEKVGIYYITDGSVAGRHHPD